MEFTAVIMKVFGFGTPGFLVVMMFCLGVGSAALVWFCINAPIGDTLKWWGGIIQQTAHGIAMFWMVGVFLMALSVVLLLVGVSFSVPSWVRPW